MPEKEKKEEMDEDELDELFEQHIKRREDPKHRGYGDYERRRIYRGPSVKKD
ncbi:hypothetical protein SAMN04488589_1824 [Methanolobus vulcani]|jgi:hypothetical protein|uniref:Uncharacterized protein n=1 Tax=Methanolobus vulcani TaxID=38026 RepID=A0A7Z7B0A7_9EURY|nr:hypothetical protein [Methanolobus vulcani]SDF95937.1 hypothetical protein SAMN04488589_1824 [Methanolobus vulcani]